MMLGRLLRHGVPRNDNFISEGSPDRSACSPSSCSAGLWRSEERSAPLLTRNQPTQKLRQDERDRWGFYFRFKLYSTSCKPSVLLSLLKS